MKTRRITEFLHEGEYVVGVEVDLIDAETGWTPCLSLEDAYKLEDARDALRRGDLSGASRYGRVYTLVPTVI